MNGQDVAGFPDVPQTNNSAASKEIRVVRVI